jgi:hypothetical protein
MYLFMYVCVCMSIYMKVNLCSVHVPALLSFGEWYSFISFFYLIV